MALYAKIVAIISIFTDFCLMAIFYLAKTGKMDIKYVGIGIQIRLALASIMGVGTEDMIVGNETDQIRYFFRAFDGISILNLYVGIYHSFIVKDLFSEERSKHIYMLASSLFFGGVLSEFMMRKNEDKDPFMTTI